MFYSFPEINNGRHPLPKELNPECWTLIFYANNIEGIEAVILSNGLLEYPKIERKRIYSK